jgi:ATP-dependent DNA ligase
MRPHAGRAGTGITVSELKRLAQVLVPLQVARMPLAEPPPRDSRFGSPLKLSRVHWVRPELVVEVTYLTRTEDNLLRQVSYQGQREDKPARQVVRPVPHPLDARAPLVSKTLSLQPKRSRPRKNLIVGTLHLCGSGGITPSCCMAE